MAKHGADVGRREWLRGMRSVAAGCRLRQGGPELGACVGPPHLRLDARVWALINIMFATAIVSIYFILIFTIAHRSDDFLF